MSDRAPDKGQQASATCSTSTVRREAVTRAVDLGMDNVDAAELARRHCRHMRLELVGGNSPLGAAVGLPMGRSEVRCEHAPPPRTQGHRVLELALEFYWDNCVGCDFREPSGGLPNLASVATTRAAQEDARRREVERAAADRARRHVDRREARRVALAGQGHVLRELGSWLEVLDRAEPRVGDLSREERAAADQILRAARHAPALFELVLVESLLGLAADVADPTAFAALEQLVRAGHCVPRRALESALAALTSHRSIEAANLLALLRDEIVQADVPNVLDQALSLTCADYIGLRDRPTAPDCLVALAEVDLDGVTRRIIGHLEDDDDWKRHIGADAARVLLAVDSARLVALGRPLAESIRGPDEGYGGHPHPSVHAARALAEAWRGEPALARGIVDSVGLVAADERRVELTRVPSWLRRGREDWDASDDATDAAIDFLVKRSSGDWGDGAADEAAHVLRDLARELAVRIVAHVDALVGQVLALCAPRTPMSGLALSPDPLEAMEASQRERNRAVRRRDLVQTIGRCAAARPKDGLGRIVELFGASTGDPAHDRSMRTTMLDGLEKAATPETVRDLLPVTYSALLSDDAYVRAGGIDLWVACASEVDTVPDELNDLAEALLADPHSVVHQSMVEQLPRLELPDRLAPRLLQILAGWLQPYRDDPYFLEKVIGAILILARQLPNEDEREAYLSYAFGFVGQCTPNDQEDLLLAPWSDSISQSQEWASLVLRAAASPELHDGHPRSEPLLMTLFDRPELIASTPLSEVALLSDSYGPGHAWRGLEPVELLQSAGRWVDAARLARAVEGRQRAGKEGRPHRLLAAAIMREAELAVALGEANLDQAGIADLTASVREATAAFVAWGPEWAAEGPSKHLVDVLLAAADAADALLDPLVTNPDGLADKLDTAAGRLHAGGPPAHACGRQRAWIADAWGIAAMLLRWDAAVRRADSDAPALLASARRRSEVLATTVRQGGVPVSPHLVDFAALASTATSVSHAQDVWRTLGRVPVPVQLVGTSLLPRRGTAFLPPPTTTEAAAPLAVCVLTLKRVPVMDVLVVRPHDVYSVGVTVHLSAIPDWATRCLVEPLSTLGRGALALPRWDFDLADGAVDASGVMLSAEAPLHCEVQQGVGDPAFDCPLVVTLFGGGRDEPVETAGCRRLRIRPFDPSSDALTEHAQTDQRLLELFDTLDSVEFDREDARAFCRLFAACVRAGQQIMFEKTFMQGSKVGEARFHNELERLLRADPELGGRLTRRDRVAGGFDDLLHDDVIVELKAPSDSPITIDKCVKYLGQPAQYGVGRGSQLSALVVLDHGKKQAPPGVPENYMGWLRPRLHGLDDPRFPTLVGVLVINTNLPIPSAWARRRIETQGG